MRIKYLNFILILSMLCLNTASAIPLRRISVKAPFKMPQIVVPDFESSKNYNILDFGAVNDGVTNNSKAIGKAIEMCNKEGGGRVVVPAGNFVTGPIYLKSNVNLHLLKGAELMFSNDPSDYLPVVQTRWEGIDVMNYSPLIYAFNETNIAVTGKRHFERKSRPQSLVAVERTKRLWLERRYAKPNKR